MGEQAALRCAGPDTLLQAGGPYFWAPELAVRPVQLQNKDRAYICGVLGREEARAALLAAFEAYMHYAFPKVHAPAMRWLHAGVHAAASQSAGCRARS